MNFNRWKKLIGLGVVFIAVMVTLSACVGGKVVLTTGFGTNEIFKVGSEKATTTEVLLYMTNIANQYEAVYGEELWQKEDEQGRSLLENLKELSIAQLSQIKAMKLLAKEHKVSLTEEEKGQALAAAQTYFNTLSEKELQYFGIEDRELIENMYEEKLLADKLYAYLIRDINPEISDDEARIITVQHILLKNYTLDEHGNRIEYDDRENSIVYQKAQEIYQLALTGESFDALISKYSEDSKGTYSFGKGEMEESFEKAAYALSTDEIAPVVKTSHGYHIIKCISTLDREQTELNKKKLLVSRKQEVFGSTYNAFISELDKRVNEELLPNLVLPEEEAVDTAELLTIYNEMLGNMFLIEE